MKVVIDIKGFKPRNSDYILRELAYSIPELGECMVYHIKTTQHKTLSYTDKSVIAWLSKNFHHIPIKGGEVKFSYLKELFKYLKTKGNPSGLELYSKGKEKTLFISKISGLPVIDLESLGCPSYKELPHYWLLCGLESHLNIKHCALKKAAALGTWLFKYILNGEIEKESRNSPTDVQMQTQNDKIIDTTFEQRIDTMSM